MTLEYKSKQPQSVFVVWTRKSTTNQVSFTTKQPINITFDSASVADNDFKSPGAGNQQSNYEKKLKRLEQTRISQAIFRRNRKLKLKRSIEKHPSIATEYNLALYNERGQPSVEECGPSSLQDVIIEIASRGAAADSSRSSNLTAPCMNLDELVEHLKLRRFILSRSATYLRQDDKTRVPIGLPTARRQAPLLLHLDHKISLPDHDFVVALGHKLIPSVYAACTINNQKEVTYSGPAYISIRSGKHDSSTAETHHRNFSLLVESKDFQSVMKLHDKCKPIVIIRADGGPDENPKYSKALVAGVNLFKKYELDCLFVVSNCPGRSAYNMVERRMVPLSNQLAGLILPHDYCGTHLNDSGKTIDSTLEIQNLRRAGTFKIYTIWITSFVLQFLTLSECLAEV
ncbi:unnamed protein product [Rotaria magnacalcarata]|uniref:Uncharacterized protein n=1 Tax=Rotaria magnacalcarata TaxID=392030 RepID=A0A816SL09_9BILA|nr:unnamed protein product [Rotaria magnacalcarata]